MWKYPFITLLMNPVSEPKLYPTSVNKMSIKMRVIIKNFISLNSFNSQNFPSDNCNNINRYSIVTARVRRTREGNVLTRVCLSVHRGGTHIS